MRFIKDLFMQIVVGDGNVSYHRYIFAFWVQAVFYFLCFSIFFVNAAKCESAECISNMKLFLFGYSFFITLGALLCFQLNRYFYGKSFPFLQEKHIRKMRNPFQGRGSVSRSGEVRIFIDSEVHERVTSELQAVVT